KTVIAHYNRGLPREVMVEWDKIDDTRYEKPGVFVVKGKIAGAEFQAEAEVRVRGAVAVENVTMAVLKNQIPALPETVTVFFNDGTEKQENVTWEAVSREKLASIGIFEIAGKVKSYDLKAKAHIRVTEKIGGQHNI